MVFYHNINPVILGFGHLQIRYYGLIYVIAIIISYLMLKYFSRKKLLRIKEKYLADLLLYLVIGALVFARIFYILFYNFNFYLLNPLNILFFWEGGLSFHGGLIGALLGSYLFWRKRRFDFWNFADYAVIPLAIGLGLGRIGNFINGELYGRITSLFLGVKFPGAEGFRHPSQLYESFKNFIIFFILFFVKDNKLPKGFLFWLFVTLYGTFRFFIEFFRAPDSQLGFIFWQFTLGQLFCLVMIIIGVLMIAGLIRKNSFS
ncbi:MAG: prolipoprotein diacylglyceryl transferase [Nanoarchaeota archaeon]|nr:prolipoprotein diacylglyceryl transferase [Nanoarchaeota archaeon]